MMRTFWQDLRYGFRMLAKSPGFTAVAIFSLALGVGANSTIFSVINSILYRPLPFENADRLVIIRETVTSERGTSRGNPKFSTFREWREQAESFEGVALTTMGSDRVTLSGIGLADHVRMSYVGPNLFSLLGVEPAVGRGFTDEDVAAGESTNVLISHGFWLDRLGAAADVLGRKLIVDGKPRTVVGVTPPDFWVVPWDKQVDVWIAFTPTPTRIPNSRWLTPLGRLKQGVAAGAAQAELSAISARVEETETAAGTTVGALVEDMHEAMFGNLETPLYFLLGAVSFVLLIACTNVANLVLARSAAREKEICVRASLGAGRIRLIRQVLTESMSLGLLGGAGGLFVTFWGVELFTVFAPSWFPMTESIEVDRTVLGFTLAVALLTGVVFGLTPALQASKVNLTESLKEGGGRAAGPRKSRGRGLLLVSEVALSVVLLVGAGLMINSFLRVSSVDPGFDTRNLLTAEIFLGGTKYWVNEAGDMKRVTPQGDLFFQRLLEGLKGLPGVESAAAITRLPFTEGRYARPFSIAGRPALPPGERPWATYNDVSPGFFQALRIPLLKGRYLNEQDVEGGPWVVVINESMAKQYFPDEDPLGKQLHVSVVSGAGAGSVEEVKSREIVGIVADVKQEGLRNESQAAMFGPHAQHAWVYPGGGYSAHLRQSLVMRTSVDPVSLIPAVRKGAAEVDADQPAYDFMTMEQRLSESLAVERLQMRLFGLFAALAIILAAVGIYGVISQYVGQRTHEIGVRRAIGAQQEDILRLVIRQGLKLTFVGIGIGLVASVGLTRLLEGSLFGVKPTDPLTYFCVTLFMTAVALLASYVPGRRATKIDPMAALRYE